MSLLESAGPRRDALALIVGVPQDAEQRLIELLRASGLRTRGGAFAEVQAAVDFQDVEIVVARADEERAAFDSLCQGPIDVPVIAVLADPSGADGARALRAGAVAVVGLDPAEADVRAALDLALRARDAQVAAEEPPTPAPTKAGLLGTSEPMQRVMELIERVAPVLATALVRGETGTGKELVARALHRLSPRKDGPFVKVHCAALPDALLESELFGYEKGAFTGATSRKPGRVELAQGGTLFLDEIGDITPAMQVKLLRLLQEKEYERLGGVETLRADVRFVAATHRDLEGMVKRGDFREDLFYRLNVVTLWLPPLRARRDDIALLAGEFCREFGAAYGKPDARLDPSALQVLRTERWPGNVRQLQNFIERLVVLATRPVIFAEDVRSEMTAQVQFKTQLTGGGSIEAASSPSPRTDVSPASRAVPLEEAVRQAERLALERALRHANGNRTIAARILGVSRATLYAKMAEYGVT